jgi:hypothetical protein
MQIQSNCMHYSTILWKFAKKDQITLGAVAKDNLLPLEYIFLKYYLF